MRVSAFLTFLACAVVCVPLHAETAAPQDYPDFTFRRVTVPSTGQGPKISVQIDPAAQAAFIASRPKPAERAPRVEDPSDTEAVPTAVAARMPAPSGWEWFWTGVSPARDAAGPENVARAIAALDGAKSLPEPRLQSLQNIAAAYGRHILGATVGTDVSPALVLALIAVESSGLAAAESGKGAQGLMQLIPDTAARFGVEDSTDPAQNIQGGVAYLAWLLEKFDGDPILALAGYNAGEGAVKKHDGVPPYPETRAYVPKVLTAWRVARGLCLTRPELITDGCVFTVQG